MEIDPDLADTAALVAAYDLPLAGAPTASGRRQPRWRGADRRLRGERRHPGRRQHDRPQAARRPQVLVPGRWTGRCGVRDGVRRHHAHRPARRVAACSSTPGRARRPGHDDRLRRPEVQDHLVRRRPRATSRAPRSSRGSAGPWRSRLAKVWVGDAALGQLEPAQLVEVGSARCARSRAVGRRGGRHDRAAPRRGSSPSTDTGAVVVVPAGRSSRRRRRRSRRAAAAAARPGRCGGCHSPVRGSKR